jgi:hypothetical protein
MNKGQHKNDKIKNFEGIIISFTNKLTAADLLCAIERFSDKYEFELTDSPEGGNIACALKRRDASTEASCCMSAGMRKVSKADPALRPRLLPLLLLLLLLWSRRALLSNSAAMSEELTLLPGGKNSFSQSLP